MELTAKLKILPDISHICDTFQGILLDAYGVFWGGNAFGLLPGSKEILQKMVSNGKVVGILSNSTQLATKEIDKLLRHGLIEEEHFHFLLTSGEIAKHIFQNEALPFETPSNKFCLFGGAHPKFSSHESIFQNTIYTETSDINEADFIYISIPHINGEDQTDPEVFRRDLEKLKIKNLPMVCPNPDRFAHEGNPPRAVVRQGSIALMYEEMGGQVFYIGKPYEKAYTTALTTFQQYNVNNPSDILMVGDTPETDIRGARKLGMPSALVVETGIMSDRISHRGPDTALESLPSHDKPDYLIRRLSDDS